MAAPCGLKKIFKTESGQCFIFSGSGTGGWEAALTNTLSPGDKVLSARYGQFSHLWTDMAERLGMFRPIVEDRPPVEEDHRLMRSVRGALAVGKVGT